MNETQHYTATVRGETRVGELDRDGDFCYMVDKTNIEWVDEAKLTDLTPVKFVPQDAVVIEGVEINELLLFVQTHPIMKVGYSYDFRALKAKLIAQLTPPKPRPVEPKGFTSQVLARTKDYQGNLGLKKLWVNMGEDRNCNWYAKDDEEHWCNLHDIEILFDAGQVK